MPATLSPVTCPHCQSTQRQIKYGRNPCGTQRYRCHACQRDYTAEPKARGYSPQLRQQAITMYVDGLNLRRIVRLLGVNPQSVANWIAHYQSSLQESGHSTLPQDPALAHCQSVELDELHTFIGCRKGEKKSGSTLPRR